METMDLAVLQNKLKTSPPSHDELKLMAAETTRNILTKIHECSESIAEAKGAAEEAKDMKVRLFGIGSKKKLNATSEAVVQTNKALSEMNNVVQESIRFTCVSYAFAEIMRDTMQVMISAGFEDANGRMKRLNENGKEAAELVLQETESFARRQKEQETQLSNLKSGITENAENIAKNAENIKGNALKINENKGNIEKNAANISKNMANIETNALRIGENKNNIASNAEKIQQLQNLMQQSTDRIDKLEKLSNKGFIIILIILTIINLCIGFFSLYLHLIK